MKPEQRKLFRSAILSVLHANGSRRFGLTPADISVMLPRFNFTAEADDVDDELHYLGGDPLLLVEVVDAKGFSPEVRNWRITTRGINFLAENE